RTSVPPPSRWMRSSGASGRGCGSTSRTCAGWGRHCSERRPQPVTGATGSGGGGRGPLVLGCRRRVGHDVRLRVQRLVDRGADLVLIRDVFVLVVPVGEVVELLAAGGHSGCGGGLHTGRDIGSLLLDRFGDLRGLLADRLAGRLELLLHARVGPGLVDLRPELLVAGASGVGAQHEADAQARQQNQALLHSCLQECVGGPAFRVQSIRRSDARHTLCRTSPTTATRERTPSFFSTFDTCSSTVRRLMTRRSAIWMFVRPSATSWAIWRSRGVRALSGSAAASSRARAARTRPRWAGMRSSPKICWASARRVRARAGWVVSRTSASVVSS